MKKVEGPNFWNFLVRQGPRGSYLGGRPCRLFRENQATDCQEIEDSRTDCCEETDRARQARNDELSMHQERNPTTESQLLAQIQDLQNKVNSLSDAREIYDPETASSSGATHVSESPGPCLASILDCRTMHGILWVPQETLLNVYLLEKDEPLLSSKIQRIWHPLLTNWDLTFQEMQWYRKGRTVEFVNTCTTLPKWRWIVKSYWCGTYSHCGVIDYPRFPISELHLGTFPGSMEFQ